MVIFRCLFVVIILWSSQPLFCGLILDDWCILKGTTCKRTRDFCKSKSPTVLSKLVAALTTDTDCQNAHNTLEDLKDRAVFSREHQVSLCAAVLVGVLVLVLSLLASIRRDKNNHNEACI